MNESKRQVLIMMAIGYWFPIRWAVDGHTYERTTYSFIGNIRTGGVQILAHKDNGPPVTVDFTNEECYGDNKLDVSHAMAKFFAAFGS